MHHLSLNLGWSANHNGDFSGDIELRAPGTPTLVVQVPYSILEAIVAEKVRRDRIAKLEDASPEELGL